jgi:hypothetical protein
VKVERNKWEIRLESGTNKLYRVERDGFELLTKSSPVSLLRSWRRMKMKGSFVTSSLEEGRPFPFRRLKLREGGLMNRKPRGAEV